MRQGIPRSLDQNRGDLKKPRYRPEKHMPENGALQNEPQKDIVICAFSVVSRSSPDQEKTTEGGRLDPALKRFKGYIDSKNFVAETGS